MFNELRQIYLELESLDLNLLMRAESSLGENLDNDLKARGLCLNKLNDKLSAWSGPGHPAEMEDLLGMHQRAMQRSRQMLKVFGHLHGRAKRNFASVAQHQNTSPYAKWQESVNRLKV